MATERQQTYSYAKTEKISVSQVLIAAQKETGLFIEESKDQTSTEMTTPFFAVGEIIGW